jgi:replication factor C large subunit
METEMWTEKYRDIKFNKIIGNENARRTLYQWMKNWKKGNKAVLLVGPPGVGKNTSVYAAAKELGYFLIELNASDFRTKEALTRKLGNTLSSSDLFDEKRMVLFDEVDGIYGRNDYGGTEYINELLEKPTVPIILTANDGTNESVIKLSRRANVICFRKVPIKIILIYLEHISELEKKKVHRKILGEISKKSRGDVRSAINLLQSIVEIPNVIKQLKIIKDTTISKQDAILTLFSERDEDKIYEIFSKMDSNAREKVQILFYSILASDFEGEQRRRALKAVSEIAFYEKRLENTQEWRMLRWFDRTVVEKIHCLNLGQRLRYSEEEPLWDLKLKYWTELRVFRMIKERVFQKYHVGVGEFALFYLPLLVTLARKEKQNVANYLRYAGFDDSLSTFIEKKVKS